MWDRQEMHAEFWKQNLKTTLKDNNIMDITEIGWEGTDWIHLAQNRERWQALVNMVMNHHIP
jgi:hypothetical protein